MEAVRFTDVADANPKPDAALPSWEPAACQAGRGRDGGTGPAALAVPAKRAARAAPAASVLHARPRRGGGDVGVAACGGCAQDTEADRRTSPALPSPRGGRGAGSCGVTRPRQHLGFPSAAMPVSFALGRESGMPRARHRQCLPSRSLSPPGAAEPQTPAELWHCPVAWAEGSDRRLSPRQNTLRVAAIPAWRSAGRGCGQRRELDGVQTLRVCGAPGSPPARVPAPTQAPQPRTHGRDCGSEGPCSQEGKTSKDLEGEKID